MDEVDFIDRALLTGTAIEYVTGAHSLPYCRLSLRERAPFRGAKGDKLRRYNSAAACHNPGNCRYSPMDSAANRGRSPNPGTFLRRATMNAKFFIVCCGL